MYTNVSRSGSSSTVTPQQPKIYLQNQLTLSKPSSEEMERPGTRRGGRPGSQSTTTTTPAEEENNITKQRFVPNTNGRQPPVVDVWTRDQSSRNSEFVIPTSSSSNSSYTKQRPKASGTPPASSINRSGNISASSSTKRQNGYPELSDPERYSSEQFDESDDEPDKKEEKEETEDEEIKRKKGKEVDDFTKRLRDLAILRTRSLHESIRSNIINTEVKTNNKAPLPPIIPTGSLKSRRSSENNNNEKIVKNISGSNRKVPSKVTSNSPSNSGERRKIDNNQGRFFHLLKIIFSIFSKGQNSHPSSSRKNSSEQSFEKQLQLVKNKFEGSTSKNKTVLKSSASSSSSNLSLSQPPQNLSTSKSSQETEAEAQQLQQQLNYKEEENKSVNKSRKNSKTSSINSNERKQLNGLNSKITDEFHQRQRRASQQRQQQKSEEGESIIQQRVPLVSDKFRFCLLSASGRQRANTQAYRKRSSSLVAPRKEEDSGTYRAWVKQKQNEQKAKKEREEAEKTALEQQRSEKRELAAKNFNRWKSELERRLAEKKAAERLKAQKKAEQEKQKKEQKQLEAQQTFQSWKKQDEIKRKTQKERARSVEQRIAKQTEQNKEQKRREAEAAFHAWIQMADERIRTQHALKQEEEERKEEERREQSKAKARIAEEAYSLWMNMKEEERKYRRSLAFRILDFERRANSERSITPWIPTSPTVIHSTHSRSTLLTPPLNSAKGRRRTLEKKLVLPDWRKHQKNKNNLETKSAINSGTNRRPWR
ncbi:unnamed protein product [Meloidogyne enterolobii]|uniref:Uncharacterized protein n=1 Tax=Meloidogyne enterolobii TaxID=390850 RepID=A0ACB0YIJ5_MELEN